MKLRWEPVPPSYGGRKGDVIADTPRDPIAYGKGRWMVKRTKGKDSCVVLRFNGDVVARHDTVAAAIADAEERTGS